MSISSLTQSQINAYNMLNAFALPRSDTNVYTSKTPATTDTLQQSLGLLSSMQKKLGMMQGNLSIMYNTAAAIRPGSSEEDMAEAYAQLRSMSAGIDELVSSSKLEGKKLFGGTAFNLTSSAGDLRMTLDNLESSDEEGLGLAYNKDSAFTTVSYDMLSLMRNAASPILGLSIGDASPSAVQESKTELDNGDYQLKVTYAGAESIVEIQKLDGTTISKAEGVDLSGSGQEVVDMGVGVSLSFDKTYFKTVLGGDKYDHQLFGPASMYARLNYERNEQHFLDDGTERELVTQDSVSVVRGATQKGTTGTVGISAAIAGVADGKTTMGSGQYRAQLRYDGARSSVWLYDQNGTLVSTKRGIDLTGTEKVSVDMETGIKLTFDPTDFTSDKRNYNTYLNYQAADVAAEVFDYDAYMEKIAEALYTIEAQMNVVSAAQGELQSRYQLQQQGVAAASSTASASTMMAQGALSLLGSAVTSDTTGIFGSIAGNDTTSTDSGLVSIFSSDIIASLEGVVASQSNVDPAVLAKLYR